MAGTAGETVIVLVSAQRRSETPHSALTSQREALRGWGVRGVQRGREERGGRGRSEGKEGETKRERDY